MADSILEKLSVTEWQTNSASTNFGTAGTTVTPPSVPTGAGVDPAQDYLHWRFARIQNLDASNVLVVRKNKPSAVTSRATAGDFTIFPSSSETLQLNTGESLTVNGNSASAAGSVVFGR